jgi:tetratricopeptide (TPR) repeat protein
MSFKLNDNSDDLTNIFDLAWDSLAAGDKDSARDNFEKIIAQGDPSEQYIYLDSFNGLGSIYFDEGNLKKAKSCYNYVYDQLNNILGEDWRKKELNYHILENRPYFRAIQGMLLVFWREKKFKKAEELAETLLTIWPNDNLGIRFIVDDIKNEVAWEDREHE